MKIRLTELIEEKSFEELSKEERSFVLAEISEQEFNEKHELISQVKTELKSEAKQLSVNESIHFNALAALKAKNQAKIKKEEEEEKGGVGFFAFKIPLWTAIAAIFMIFILSTPIFIDSEFDKENSNTLMAVVDTVYIDKIIRDTIEIIQPADTIVKTIFTSKVASDEIAEVSSSSSNYDVSPNEASNEIIIQELNNPLNLGNYKSTIDFKSTSSGRSLSEDKIGRVLLGYE